MDKTSPEAPQHQRQVQEPEASPSVTLKDDEVAKSMHQPVSNEKDHSSEYEVHFEPDDPDDPLNWSRARRWYITMAAGLMGVNATFTSSVPSGIIPQLEKHFTFSREVGILTISLFVGGYCVGPLFWGPLSEHFGRKKPLFLSFLSYTAFSVGCALAPNTASILVFRFLSGMCASSGLVVTAALISDMWDADTRGRALTLYTLAPFAGPCLAPVVSGFMSVSGVYWRWVFWVSTIFTGFCAAVILFTMPETFKPLILANRAKRLRKETGNDRYYAPVEKIHLSFTQVAVTVVTRPALIFVQEPMLIALSLYMSFIYGVVYLLFEAYPIVFEQGHGFNAGVSGLMFLPIIIGGCVAVLLYVLVWSPRYERLSRQFAPHPVPPEYRLEQAIWAAPIFAGSFFWFGWTSYPGISFWAPMMAGNTLGFSMLWIFLGLFNYIIDTYLIFAASALAANTVLRSSFAAGFALFASQMYETLDPRWASTLLGFIAMLLMPIPVVLFKFGPTLRKNSKYAPKQPAIVVPEPSGDETV